jgi:MerR HTH family regulatory protein
MTETPSAAAVFDDQVTDGAAPTGMTSDLAEGIVPAAADRPPLARFYMTSDLRAATGLPRTHLDYYLREGLILPTARTESGYLLFDETELETLRSIIAERQSGVAIREIRRRLGR